MTKLWCAKIQLTTQKRLYRFSNDLQRALNQTTHPQQILQALIVVPLAPYTKQHQPPMGIGKIQKIYKQSQFKAHGLPVTRGQFISKEYWTERSYDQVFSYLKHDYSWWSQQQIRTDITYWQKQFYQQGVRLNQMWRRITNSRIRHQLNREHHLKNQKRWQYWRL